MKKPRVLIISPFYPPNLGGVETHLATLTEYLRQNDYRVTVLTYRPFTVKIDHYLPREKKKNLEVYRFWWFGRHWWFDKTTPYPPLQFLYVVPGLLLNSLVYIVKNSKRIDVIHAQGFVSAFIARILKVFFPGKRMVVSTHFIYRRLRPGNLYAFFFKRIFEGFDKILVVGEESRKELENIGLDPKKMKLFSHWLDEKVFVPKDKIECQKKLRLPLKNKLTVLFVGRLLRMKGIFQLIEAACSLPADITFVFVGEGPDGDELRKTAGRLSNVFIVGRKEPAEVVDYLGACDLLILPSITDEGQPLVIMESLACGRPVVVTNKGSAKEMFDESVGKSISPTVPEIKKAILEFYRNPGVLWEMTKNARPYATKKFGTKKARVIVDCYYD